MIFIKKSRVEQHNNYIFLLNIVEHLVIIYMHETKSIEDIFVLSKNIKYMYFRARNPPAVFERTRTFYFFFSDLGWSRGREMEWLQGGVLRWSIFIAATQLGPAQSQYGAPSASTRRRTAIRRRQDPGSNAVRNCLASARDGPSYPNTSNAACAAANLWQRRSLVECTPPCTTSPTRRPVAAMHALIVVRTLLDSITGAAARTTRRGRPDSRCRPPRRCKPPATRPRQPRHRDDSALRPREHHERVRVAEQAVPLRLSLRIKDGGAVMLKFDGGLGFGQRVGVRR